MNEDQILDAEIPEDKKKKYFWFQIIEFVLVGIFCSFLLFNVTKIAEVVIILQAVIFVFMLVRIYFEYKNELITGFGVILRFIIMLIATIILIAIEFKVLGWPYSSEMIIVGLTSMGFPYMLYAFTLKDVVIPVKVILFFNSLFLSIFALGLLFKIESWPNALIMFTTGGALTVLSLAAFAYIPRINPTRKEIYHSSIYLARTLAFLFFGYLAFN